MSLRLFALPLNPDEWPRWLEQEIVGPRLVDFVSELEVIYRSERPTSDLKPTLESILSDDLEIVVESGLGRLRADQIRQLLENPSLLLELQEKVLLGESPYWIARCDEAHEAQASDSLTPSADPEQPLVQSGRRSVIGRRALAVILGIAAMIFVAVSLGRFLKGPPQPQPWGFQNPRLFVRSVEPQDYLEALAGAAAQWYDERPDTRDSLVLRLREFSSGCAMVLEHEHGQLSDLDWQWLTNKCQLWKDSIDDFVQRLESEQDSVPQVRTKVDQLVDEIIESLHDRANSIG
ncbi:hypothetical protein Mal15_54340 [Stieleria maiorica]|uniref:Uncharacterized protein n=1 Tax=Stieleria maiorica TaxID=2795974 RepID=A0A5B9MQR6_9BACT|nr:hypothetical protein [Stieleria maiorica]QEG01358.1 hypothetical protein Mal15_54340 [Stieleria maiorica]